MGRRSGLSRLMQMMMACLFTALVFLHPSLLAAVEGHDWSCTAEGVFVSCSDTRSWVPCQDFRSRGTANAADRLDAVIKAEEECSDDMIRRMILANRSGKSSVKERCAMTVCELKQGD